jgi:multiple sugar transport system ATP-binding protein
MSAVKFSHVSKNYGDGIKAVDDLNLPIEDGEFMVLVGPSGCGKSTALRMIAGLEEITEGDLLIGEERVNDIAPGARDVAMVFQNYALYPHMSVRENMGFALEMAKVNKREIAERVDRAADILGLREYLDRRPRALSGGQRQRVAMGRAIVREPRVFLMDEPLSNLDAKLRVQMRAEIIRLQRELGTTTVYVTHDQVEAMTMGDRVAVMRKGILQQVASPAELYDHPANLFVAGFIGSPAMNFITATLERDGDAVLAVVGSHRLSLSDELLGAYPAYAAHLGSPVILGVRPEHLQPGTAISARVEISEALGAENHVHFTLDVAPVQSDLLEGVALVEGDGIGSPNTTAIVARLPGTVRVRAGEQIGLDVRTELCHLFDATTGAPLR